MALRPRHRVRLLHSALNITLTRHQSDLESVVAVPVIAAAASARARLRLIVVRNHLPVQPRHARVVEDGDLGVKLSEG